MPQLAPMPWLTLFFLLFFFKSSLFTTLWAHRPPLFHSHANLSPTASTTSPWPWQ